MPGHQPDWSCWCQDDWCVTGDCKTGAGEVQDHWHSSSTASVCASASSAVRLVYILTTRHTRGHSHTQYHHQHHSIQQISSHTPSLYLTSEHSFHLTVHVMSSYLTELHHYTLLANIHSILQYM